MTFGTTILVFCSEAVIDGGCAELSKRHLPVTPFFKFILYNLDFCFHDLSHVGSSKYNYLVVICEAKSMIYYGIKSRLRFISIVIKPSYVRAEIKTNQMTPLLPHLPLK